MAEIEFKSVEESKTFEAPHRLANEITERKEADN